MNVVSGATRRVAMIVFATLVLALSACSAASGAEGPALGFAGTTVDGSRFDAATLAGTPTVLWFWTPL